MLPEILDDAEPETDTVDVLEGGIVLVIVGELLDVLEGARVLEVVNVIIRSVTEWSGLDEGVLEELTLDVDVVDMLGVLVPSAVLVVVDDEDAVLLDITDVVVVPDL